MAKPTQQSTASHWSVRFSSRITVHALRTGWVAVKEPHRRFDGPSWLRIPAIMASLSWSEWLPVLVFAIEHPGGIIMVDTGETEKINDGDYVNCDPITGLFYKLNLRFQITATDEIAAQLNAAGLARDRVTDVVMTHLHSDHMGGMAVFPQARFHISERAKVGHAGALMCRVPQGINIVPTRLSEIQAGVFGKSCPLALEGAISIIPTPGHASGHQSVLISDEGRSLCIVGDAAFTAAQIETGELGGIVESVTQARRSSESLLRQAKSFGTIMLPSHDPDTPTRLLAAVR
jgi:N-acyl homoserine lactone hydrolase